MQICRPQGSIKLLRLSQKFGSELLGNQWEKGKGNTIRHSQRYSLLIRKHTNSSGEDKLFLAPSSKRISQVSFILGTVPSLMFLQSKQPVSFLVTCLISCNISVNANGHQTIFSNMENNL